MFSHENHQSRFVFSPAALASRVLVRAARSGSGREQFLGFAKPSWNCRWNPAPSVLASGWIHRHGDDAFGKIRLVFFHPAGRYVKRETETGLGKKWTKSIRELPFASRIFFLFSLEKPPSGDCVGDVNDPPSWHLRSACFIPCMWFPYSGRTVFCADCFLLWWAAADAVQSSSAWACGRSGGGLALALEWGRTQNQAGPAAQRADLKLQVFGCNTARGKHGSLKLSSCGSRAESLHEPEAPGKAVGCNFLS